MSNPPSSIAKNDQIYRETKWLAAVIIPFLVAAFGLLFFWPNDTDKTFAWTILPSMTPMMLASAYMGGIYYFTGVIVAKRWHQIKVGFLPVTAFASILSIATLLHWDRFNHSHISFFTWTALYMTTPFLVIAAWLRNRVVDPGSADPDDVLIPISWRWVMCIFGTVTLLVSVVLFLQPSLMIATWAWKLTPLTARVLGAMFALPGLVGLGVAIDARWSNARLILQSQAFSILFILISAARAWGDFDPSNPVTYLFTGGLVFMFIAIAAFSSSWNRADPKRQQLSADACLVYGIRSMEYVDSLHIAYSAVRSECKKKSLSKIGWSLNEGVSKMKPISSVAQITPDWLTQALRQSGHLDQGQVIAVVAQGNQSAATEGPGFQSNNRIEIQYSSDATPSAPRLIYLKAQFESPGLNQFGGEREVAFYSSVAGQMPYPLTPICFDAAYDPETRAYHLLLEDVSKTHRTVHPEQPATRDDTDRMLNALARLHAHWWGHPQLGQSVGTVPSPEAIRASFAHLEKAFPEYVDFLDDRLSTERRQVYESILNQYPDALIHRLAQRETLTLAHVDAHAGNFLLPRQAAGQPVYMIDWQQWGVQVGLHDVAYLIALFWYPERRARMEQSVVKGYHSRLQQYGVKEYDWPACWDDYRLQAIGNLLVPFWAWVFHKQHWGFHRWHQLEKAMLAFQDLKCVEFLK